jgi:DNA-binding transcriptional LysR family regulator
MLDVHRLRVFRSVVASGSIQAAAVNLGYTASAVSQHVSTLQRETGLTLVSRIGRGIEPTAAGLALAEEIDGVLSRLGDVESFVADLRAGRSGSLSIAYFASVGSAWMPHVVRRLLHDFPGIRLNLSLRDDMPANPSERADIQIIVEQDDFSGIGAHHLLDDPYVAVLPTSHPLAGAKAVELMQLAGEKWVDNDLARGWCRRNLVQACQAAGFTPPFHVEAHDYPTAIAFVDAGIGLTVLPRLGARNLPAGVVAVPVEGPTPQRSIYALVQPSIADTAPARAVLDTLARCAKSGSEGTNPRPSLRG